MILMLQDRTLPSGGTSFGKQNVNASGSLAPFVHPVPRAALTKVCAILHTDLVPQRSGPPPMLQGLGEYEVMTGIRSGTRKVIDRGESVFSQGHQHDEINLIESGCVRVFYTSPAGREATLAYRHPGNFVGGPEIFGDSLHVCSGVAVVSSSVLHLKAQVLRALIAEIPALGLGIIEGLSFKGKCYSAMAQMLGTRAFTERSAHLLLHLAEL